MTDPGQYRPMPQTQQQPPGWYDTGPYQQTFWDGRGWTPHRRTPPEKVMEPALGWVLLGLGAAIAVGSLLPWVTALDGVLSKSGTDGGDGYISLILAVALGAVGIAVGVKQGQIWAPIVGTLVAVAVAGLAAYEINDVSGHTGVSVGVGLWLMAVAALASVVVAACGFGVKTMTS